jgi:hypothetical protein
VAGVPGRDDLQVGGQGGAGRNEVGPAGGVLELLALLSYPHDDGDEGEEGEGVEITVEWLDFHFQFSDSRRVLEAEKTERDRVVATCAMRRRPKSTACVVVCFVVTGGISLRGFCRLVTAGHKCFSSSLSGFCPFLAKIRRFLRLFLEVLMHFSRSVDQFSEPWLVAKDLAALFPA